MKASKRSIWLGLGAAAVFALGSAAGHLATVAAQDDRRTPVIVTRIYTGDDGKTHVEEKAVDMRSSGGAGELAETIDVTGLIFRRTPPDYYLDFHNAPRRQYVITLSGEGEVELGDGTIVPLTPGTILLAEDTEGQGHISRGRGTEDRISIFLPLAEDEQ